ncbi:histidinol-phosphate transaminase [Dokdonia sp. Hel_I_53]|uniref:histidinol-phosphate transaminase n=1 Tax=Dokdonia sp. Hel_I_53 TaxID=1566287 RepID=UPI00119AF6BC|nr:histidinol-phosphate transaminase [Dokdonia sp. Hel_I_53]TVZ51670.1 histidinol-phosphate aminotransferase [Dokdonia sp. Hel_I_53]
MKTEFDLHTLVRANVAAMQPYSSARDEFKDFDQEMIFLDANENPFDTSFNRYPDPKQRDLKTLITETEKLDKAQLFLGNGSDEVLDLLFRAFCNPGKDNVLIVPPTYGMYKVLAQTNDIGIKEVPLDLDFQVQTAKVLEAVDAQTKLIFICSPNNPTGNSIARDKIEKLLANFNGLVIVDEAYVDFTDTQSWSQRLKDFPNLVVVKTMSKAYGLAGLRLGMCWASSEIVAILNKIKPPYNVNVLTQQQTLARYAKKQEVAEEIANIKMQRATLAASLKECSFVSQVFPSEANFILARVDDANMRYQQLIEKGIVIRNRSTQTLCENTLRFTVGTPEENNKLITALDSLV